MIKNVLHLKAPKNWINDPNGFIYYNGNYHLFYQHFPYAPRWGTMHWGHAVSEDLIHWEHLDVALFPTKGYDQDGIFSGSAIEKDGALYLYYSAVRYLIQDVENIHHPVDEQYETSQAMMISQDGYYFDNWNAKKQIIPVIQNEEIANATHTRDPKVWKDGDNYYMILGSTFREEVGRVLFYKSKDAVNWKYVNQYRNAVYGKILECPDLFLIGDQYIFIGSPMRMIEDGLKYTDQTVCALADFNTETCELQLSDHYQYVDYGLDLYAPQTNIDKDGRRVMIAWMRMPKAVETEVTWRGMMCLPRVVEVVDNHIYFRVHPEVEHYFSKEVEKVEQIAYEHPYRLKVTLEENEKLNIGGYQIWVEDDCVKVDRSQVLGGAEGYRMISSTPKLYNHYQLDIFVEPNLIETFINNGQYVMSHIVYDLNKSIDGRIEQILVGEHIVP